MHRSLAPGDSSQGYDSSLGDDYYVVSSGLFGNNRGDLFTAYGSLFLKKYVCFFFGAFFSKYPLFAPVLLIQ